MPMEGIQIGKDQCAQSRHGGNPEDSIRISNGKTIKGERGMPMRTYKDQKRLSKFRIVIAV